MKKGPWFFWVYILGGDPMSWSPSTVLTGVESSRCFSVSQMSSDQNTGWLVDIGGYTAQLYGHYNKP